MNHSPELQSEPASQLETQLDDAFLIEMSGNAWRFTPEQDESEIIAQLRRAFANHAFAQHQDLSALRSHATEVYTRHRSYRPPLFVALLQRSTCNELRTVNYPDDQYHRTIGRLEDILKPNLKQFLPEHRQAIRHHFSPADQAPPYYTGSYIDPLLDSLRKRFETWYSSFTKQSAVAYQTFQMLLGNDEHRPFSMKELLAELPEAEHVDLIALVETEIDTLTRLISPQPYKRIGTAALPAADVLPPPEPAAPQAPPLQQPTPQTQKDQPAPILLRSTPIEPVPRVQFVPKPEPQPMSNPEPQPEPKRYSLLSGVPLPPDLVGGVDPPTLNRKNHSDLAIYLAEIHRYRLLRAEEEVSLAQRREAGMYAEKLLETWIDENGKSVIRSSLRQELEHLVCEGRMAEERLINHNLRLAKTWALARQQHYSKVVSAHDVIQAANRGLMEGVWRFDFTKGYKLSTYVVPWIRRDVGVEIDKALSDLSVPAYVRRQIRQLGSTEMHLREQLQRQPTREELSQELGWDIKKINHLYSLVETSLHLDMILLGDERHTLHGIIRDKNAIDPQKEAEKAALRQELDTVLMALKPGEREVVVLHFGLGTNNPLEVSKIAKKLGIDHSTVTNRLQRGLERLRSEPVLLEKLRDFLALSNED